MGSDVTRSAHSRWAVALLLLLAACLEPAPAARLEPGGTVYGEAKRGRCSPANCTGCCAGDVCRGGNTDDACGYDGHGCNTCVPTHRCEAPGACYPLPMAETSSLDSPDADVRCWIIEGETRCQ